MLEIKIPADINRLNEVLEFVGASISNIGADGKFINNINIAVEEIFVNIANYAYTSVIGNVAISVTSSNDTVTIEFTDSGTPYNPLANDDPDITLSAEEREIGGLGIFMVKNIMDDVSYRFENENNILTISKQWSGSK